MLMVKIVVVLVVLIEMMMLIVMIVVILVVLLMEMMMLMVMIVVVLVALMEMVMLMVMIVVMIVVVLVVLLIEMVMLMVKIVVVLVVLMEMMLMVMIVVILLVTMATDARKMAPYSYLVLTVLTAGVIVYPHMNFPDNRDNNTAILGNGSSPHIKIYGQYSRRIVSHNNGVITSLTKADSLYSWKTGSYSSSSTTISNLCYQVPAATMSNNYLETQIGGIKAHVICYRRYESDRLDRIFNRCRNFMIQMKEIVSNFDDDHASFSPAKFNWRITATFIDIALPISTLRITLLIRPWILETKAILQIFA